MMASLVSPVVPELSLSTGIRSVAEARALKVHSEGERRRRDRINAHLATLRSMIPDATQMDKATLLANVVNRVKHLKRKATEITMPPQGTAPPIPPEANEVTVQCYTAGDGRRITYIRATVGCEDRPGLFADLAGAFHGLRLAALRAEVASLGGRAHHVFVLCKEDGGVVDGGGARGLRSLEEGVRRVLAEISFPEMVRAGSSGRKRLGLFEAQSARSCTPY